MMTTMAALLSGIPLAFGSGIGSELRKPLGVAMVGGLLVSQVLTLYTTPVIYIFFDNLGQRASRTARAVSSGRRRSRHEPIAPLRTPPGGHHAADACRRPGGSDCIYGAAGVSAAAGGLSHHHRGGDAARRQSGHHGIFGRHAAGAGVRPYFRHHRDDLVEHPGDHQRHDAVRS